MMMGGRARAQSVTASGNSKAQLIAAYNELGKELGDRRMRVVGNYTIGRAIGEGSYGKVRLGTHRLTGTKVALKQIPKDCSAQLTREIHHHRQLHHPHIVQLYEVIATESSIWLVTELCNGGELFDYLVEKGRFDEYETRILFGQLCLAIAYCHEQGVVHRDIKLENVLLDEHCQVKLSDFGFTREFERGSLLETFCGTTGYASPEMLQGQKYLGPEVDVWSLGIILYSLLVGTLPFDDDDEEETKRKVLAGDFDMPEWISPEVGDLLKGVLELDPAKRFTMQQVLASPWFSKHIYPSSPPPTEAILPSTGMDGESKPSRPASVSLDGVLASSIVPDQRPSTPPNQPALQGTSVDQTPRPRLSESGPEASPSRPHAERKNSTQSIAPPLPTRTPVRTKRRSVSSTVSPPATPKVRPLSAALTATEPVDFFGAMKKQTAVVFSSPQERLMLSSLAALGFDTGQIVHSVLTNACDSAGALWWIMRKKLGNNYMLPEEHTGQVVPDPSSDGGLQIIAEASGSALELDETGQGASVNGIRPMVLLEEVDASKKKKQRPHADSVQESSDAVIPTKDKEKLPSSAPPDFAIVPATPITAEELSKASPLPTSLSTLSPIRSLPSPTTGIDSHNSSPSGSKINANRQGRTSSISMLQRATTVLGGAAGLVRKKSEENGLRDSGGSREKERSSDEPRSSNGSGRLTKSPPPGKVSREAKERERENSAEISSVQKTSGNPSTPATFPGHIKSSSTVAKSNVQQPAMRRSATEGSSLTSPSLNRELAKPRNRTSILNTFRTWLGNDSKRERKGGFTFGTPSNTPTGKHSSPPSAYSKGYFNQAPFGYPERAPTPRKRTSTGKGTASRRGGRGHKDKRPSISSRRSSSVPSRRSSVGSLASLAKQKGVLGSVDEYSVYNGEPLSRRMSSNSRRSIGAKTPIDEDPFGPSRPGSARSNSMNTSLAKRGKRHSKSSSTSSGGSLGRRGNNRPPSRSGTTSPTGNRAHRRAGSGGSQTRVVKQHVKPSSSIAKSLAAGATEHATISTGTRRMRSGSQSSAHSEEMSAVDDDAEFGGRRTTSPLGRPMRAVMVAQKKSAYGTPNGSLGLSASRSSWKKSWGPEPPGWAHRAAHPGVVIEVLDSRSAKTGVRDVFAGGGKSGVPPGTTSPGDDEDDWSDVDEEVVYVGGLGQLGSGHNLVPNADDSVMPPDSPMMVFTNSRAGRRTKRTPGNVMNPGQYNKASGSPAPVQTAAPASPPNQASTSSMNESMNLDRSTSRRQLPGNRTFRGPAIVEEEEEEEE